MVKRIAAIALAVALTGCVTTTDPIDSVPDLNQPILVDQSEEAAEFIMDEVKSNYILKGGTEEMFSDAYVVCFASGTAISGLEYTYKCTGTFPQMNTVGEFFCDGSSCLLEKTNEIHE